MSILINKDTSFIIQGITGREAVSLTRENLDYGANIIGGVTPGRAGRDIYGVPVYDCVRDVVEKHGQPEGSIVSVPPKFARDAVFEALENGIKTIVIVTENIPRKQVAQMVELAKLRGARIIGPNCLGIISPGEAKMGGVGGPAANTRQAYSQGNIGVMSRSGGMTTEIASTLAAAGPGDAWKPNSPIGSLNTIRGFRSWPSWRAASWTRCRACALVTQAPSSKARKTPRSTKFSAWRRPGSRLPNASKKSPYSSNNASPPASLLGTLALQEAQRNCKMPGLFIDVQISDDIARDVTIAKKLEESCSVDIFKASDKGVEVVEENLDECVLCDLCLAVAPKGSVRIVKLYDQG